jgi:hypothetical protein
VSREPSNLAQAKQLLRGIEPTRQSSVTADGTIAGGVQITLEMAKIHALIALAESNRAVTEEVRAVSRNVADLERKLGELGKAADKP